MVLPLKHMSASAASEYAPQYQLGGVRLGRRLYMDHPTKPLGDIQEVATWQCWITNLRQLRKGGRRGLRRPCEAGAGRSGGHHLRGLRGRPGPPAGGRPRSRAGRGEAVPPVGLLHGSDPGGRDGDGLPGGRPGHSVWLGRGGKLPFPPRRWPCSSERTRAAASPPVSAPGWPGSIPRSKEKNPGGGTLRDFFRPKR